MIVKEKDLFPGVPVGTSPGAVPLRLKKALDGGSLGEFTASGQTDVYRPGTTVCLSQGGTHTWKVVGDEPARMLIMAMPAGLEEYFRKLSKLGAKGPPDMDKLLRVSEEHGIEFPDL